MRFLPTSIHGMLDYMVGSFLVAMPWIFQFASGGAETWVPVVLGLATIGYSLVTAYDAGLLGLIKFSTHQWIDDMHGLLLAASPWLFDFNWHTWIPFVVMGGLEILISHMTVQRPPVRVRHTRWATSASR